MVELWSSCIPCHLCAPSMAAEARWAIVSHKYLNMSSCQDCSCRGCLICIWRYQNLAEQVLSIPNIFCHLSSAPFQHDVSRFPWGLCSRKVSYIKLAALMLGLLIFFFNIQKAVKKKIKMGKKQEEKTCTQLWNLALSAMVRVSRYSCSKMEQN